MMRNLGFYVRYHGDEQKQKMGCSTLEEAWNSAVEWPGAEIYARIDFGAGGELFWLAGKVALLR